jgi:hypothetical protein
MATKESARMRPTLWTRNAAIGLAIAASAGAAGCGGSSGSSGSSGGGGSSSAAEAKATAGGDIPDNQVFLTYRNQAGGYSLSYPEGWTRKVNGSSTTFTDKENSITAAVNSGAAATTASVSSQLAALKTANSTLKAGKPQRVRINGAPVIKVTYRSLGAKDPVTGKRLEIITDRYEYSKGGRVAVLDLATPKGVDNVDAYRMISESFRWR